MFQAVAGLALRFHQEVVARIMMRPEQDAGFGYQVAESRNPFGRKIESFRRFLKEVQRMALRDSLRRDIEFAHDGSAHQGGIDQRGERYCIKMNAATLR